MCVRELTIVAYVELEEVAAWQSLEQMRAILLWHSTRKEGMLA